MSQPFDDPTARAALYEGIRTTAGTVPVLARPEHINDPAFAQAAEEALLALLLPPGNSARE